MLEQQWVLNNHHDKERLRKLAEEINVPELIANILFNRGITTFDEAKNFFLSTIFKMPPKTIKRAPKTERRLGMLSKMSASRMPEKSTPI